MMRLNKLLMAFFLLAMLGGFSGCVYTPGRHVHMPPAYGPPPYAPAHGYRYRFPDGRILVYDANLHAYIVFGYTNVYYSDGFYYRRVRNHWEKSPSLRKQWRVIDYRGLPGGLQSRYGGGSDQRRDRPDMKRERRRDEPGRKDMERPGQPRHQDMRGGQGRNEGDARTGIGRGQDNRNAPGRGAEGSDRNKPPKQKQSAGKRKEHSGEKGAAAKKSKNTKDKARDKRGQGKDEAEKKSGKERDKSGESKEEERSGRTD